MHEAKYNSEGIRLRELTSQCPPEWLEHLVLTSHTRTARTSDDFRSAGESFEDRLRELTSLDQSSGSSKRARYQKRAKKAVSLAREKLAKVANGKHRCSSS